MYSNHMAIIYASGPLLKKKNTNKKNPLLKKKKKKNFTHLKKKLIYVCVVY